MEFGKLLVTVSYAYPLTLYLVLSISLLAYRRRAFENEATAAREASTRRPLYRIVYFLQLFLSIILFLSLGIGVVDFVKALQHKAPSQIPESLVVSRNLPYHWPCLADTQRHCLRRYCSTSW
jgi:amino acid transporter